LHDFAERGSFVAAKSRALFRRLIFIHVCLLQATHCRIVPCVYSVFLHHVSSPAGRRRMTKLRCEDGSRADTRSGYALSWTSDATNMRGFPALPVKRGRRPTSAVAALISRTLVALRAPRRVREEIVVANGVVCVAWRCAARLIEQRRMKAAETTLVCWIDAAGDCTRLSLRSRRREIEIGRLLAPSARREFKDWLASALQPYSNEPTLIAASPPDAMLTCPRRGGCGR